MLDSKKYVVRMLCTEFENKLILIIIINVFTLTIDLIYT